MDTIGNVPFVSNLVVSFALVHLERMVETDFSCLCDPAWNAAMVAMCFSVPVLFTFTLMCFILDNKHCCDNAKDAFICLIPGMVWVILLFFDGRYVACAATKWSGKYATIDKNDHKNWCEPATNSTSTQELLMTTEWWFGFSQVSEILVSLICIDVYTVLMTNLIPSVFVLYFYLWFR